MIHHRFASLAMAVSSYRDNSHSRRTLNLLHFIAADRQGSVFYRDLSKRTPMRQSSREQNGAEDVAIDSN
jgi:hypothetical protein